MRLSNSAVVLAVVSSCVTAQIVYNDTQIYVRSDDQYNGASLIGYHVGAALSYVVARTGGSGSSFGFNLSASSAQLLDNDIAAEYQLPCYIINTPQISDNAGPLECGAGDQNGYYDVASVSQSSGPASGTITFAGVNQWYICAAQSFTYGWVQGTIVGSFGNSAPSGPGIQNCTSVNGIAFAASSTSSTATSTVTGSSTGSGSVANTASTTGSMSNMAPTSPSQGVTSAASSGGPDPEQGSIAYSSTMATTVVPRPSVIRPSVSNPVASYNPIRPDTSVGVYDSAKPWIPVATFTGAASITEASSFIVLIVAAGALLL